MGQVGGVGGRGRWRGQWRRVGGGVGEWVRCLGCEVAGVLVVPRADAARIPDGADEGDEPQHADEERAGLVGHVLDHLAVLANVAAKTRIE